ncbi:MAG: protein adenylyltransferase SelO [Clostridiales bacterium]
MNKFKNKWNFDNSYSHLPEVFFSSINPIPVKSPELIVLNYDLADFIGMDIELLESDEGMSILSGNRLPKSANPIAQAYAGHQFGHFTMLGDGRAILIGECNTIDGNVVELQLKGSGRTPYSRGGDGRASLGPMLREYIISEAIYRLGIPTNRSLAVVSTGENIIREKILPGAILTRVAKSYIRVGTFEYASKLCSFKNLKLLADYTINRYFKDANSSNKNPYVMFLHEVIKQQAFLIAKWQLVGFIHGVMNTDNMSVSGETIDYGPCAFMDTYDSKTVFSSIDHYGRYSYGNQPHIASWNLSRFAESLLPLLNEKKEKSIEIANDAISKYNDLYKSYWISGMRSKLGLFNEEQIDHIIIKDILKIMEKNNLDYTNTFIALTMDKLNYANLDEIKEFREWHELWRSRINRQQKSKEEIYSLMKNNNPSIIPRNYLVEEALNDAVDQKNLDTMKCLLNILKNPYDYSKEQLKYFFKLPKKDINYRTFCGT